MKRCTKCGIAKPFSAFTKDKLGRYGLASRCAECKRALFRQWRSTPRAHDYMKQWNADHRERRNESARRWRAADPQRARIIVSAYHDRNKEKDAERNRRYRKNNPESHRERVRRRDFTKKNASPKWGNRTYIRDMYFIARLVTEATGIKHHVDHIVPLESPIVCGLHVEHNLQVIPAAQNQKKKNRHWPDMP